MIPLIFRHFRFFIILAGFFILGFCFTGCVQKPDEVKLADYLMAQHFTTGADSSQIFLLSQKLLEETRWQNEIQLNKSYNPDKVNIYVLPGNSSNLMLDPVAAQLIEKCSFIGYNIIILDDDYLNSFLTSHHVKPDPKTSALMDDQPAFLYWAIGHELGHLVCGHSKGHFDASPLDKFVKTSSIENRQELQADSFFVKAMVTEKYLRYSEQRLMMNILNTEIEQKVGKIQTMGVGIIYDYSNQQVVTYARQSTHPEYVVRLSRMLDLSTKMGKDTGLQNLVSGFLRQLKEAPQIQIR